MNNILLYYINLLKIFIIIIVFICILEKNYGVINKKNNMNFIINNEK